MQILIVEDNEDIRTALVLSLGDEGYEVTAAADGDEAFVALEKETPDVILLDMHLPGMSGIEILKKIRQVLDIPIFMFTSSGDRTVVENAIAAGATGYVLKGSGMDQLIERIRKHIIDTGRAVEDAVVGNISETPAHRLPQILYVGQNVTVSRLLTDLARRHDIELTMVATSKVALAGLTDRRPIVIVLDLKLQDIKGLNLLKAIKESENASGVPTVVISDREPPEIRRSAARHGAVGVFSTPVEEVEFEQLIRDLVFAAKRAGAA